MNTIEIELRYEILDLKQIKSFFDSLNFIHKKHDIDIYLDTPQINLYKQGIYVRIRNNKKLDIKFNRACIDNPNLEPQDYCEEHSFILPLQKQDLERLNCVFSSLKLKPIFNADLNFLKSENNFDTLYIIDKLRTTYTHNSFTLALDEVSGLGTFIEIELMANNTDNLETAKKDMEQALVGLNLRPLRAGYGTLLMKKNNFERYLQGRFVLPEDRSCRKFSE